MTGDPNNPVGNFNYVQHIKAPNFVSMDERVEFNGETTTFAQCSDGNDIDAIYEFDECETCQNKFGAGAYIMKGTYESTNSKKEGSGGIYVCAKDNGEGSMSPPDEVSITLSGGPFDGYSVEGEMKGNIQAHSCEEDGDDRRLLGLRKRR